MFLDIIKVTILSFVEGLTEFIPVSSTGHMIIVENFLKLSNDTNFVNSFQIIIQLGAILSVVVYYRSIIFPIDIKFWLKLCLCIIPFGIIGVLFEDKIDRYLFNSTTVSIALIVYGIILIVIEKYNKNKEKKIKDLNKIDLKTSFFIGLFQCLAIIPGTSRSAATIIGAMLLGIDRVVATQFSFS